MGTSEKIIPFSPPDITEAEIAAVSDVLRSGWITTGPRTKELEVKLRNFTGAAGLACLNSATAALECALRLCGIGSGDEVIVPAYTYTASASVVQHVGATLVLVDVAPGSFFPSAKDYAAALSPRTKAIIPVDIAGVMANYEELFAALEGFEGWQPANAVQEYFARPIVIADAAHALGAMRAGQSAGSVADFTAFSFHAVKNFTTAEGGALAWRNFGADTQQLYQQIMLYSLHGQNKDALHKESGNWEYDIEFCGYKWNMTDVAAALGLAQLERYPQLLARRRELVARYEAGLAGLPVQVLAHWGKDTGQDVAPSAEPVVEQNVEPNAEQSAAQNFASSCHLMLARIEGANEAQRNAIIKAMAQAGIACNVHYKPLPLLSAYKKLGFNIADFPNAKDQYENEISLPLHTLLSSEDVDYVCEQLSSAIRECL